MNTKSFFSNYPSDTEQICYEAWDRWIVLTFCSSSARPFQGPIVIYPKIRHFIQKSSSRCLKRRSKVSLDDGQTEAGGVPSQGGRDDALLRRSSPNLTWPDLTCPICPNLGKEMCSVRSLIPHFHWTFFSITTGQNPNEINFEVWEYCHDVNSCSRCLASR